MAMMPVRLFAILLVCLAASAASAQDTTATLLGTLTDSSGSVLPGVAISVRNLDTSQARTVTSDEGGRYRLPLLPPGRYELTAQLSGFQTAVRSGITLTVGQEAVVNMQMALGNVTESIRVDAAAPLVETTTGTISHVVGAAPAAPRAKEDPRVRRREKCRPLRHQPSAAGKVQRPREAA